MTATLAEAFTRSRRPPLPSVFFSRQDQLFQEDIEKLENIAKDLLRARREHPTDKRDLLNAMINNKDPKTGESLDETTIIRNMITFLIAGRLNSVPGTWSEPKLNLSKVTKRLRGSCPSYSTSSWPTPQPTRSSKRKLTKLSAVVPSPWTTWGSCPTSRHASVKRFASTLPHPLSLCRPRAIRYWVVNMRSRMGRSWRFS